MDTRNIQEKVTERADILFSIVVELVFVGAVQR